MKAALSKKVTDSSDDIKERAARPAFFEYQIKEIESKEKRQKKIKIFPNTTYLCS